MRRQERRERQRLLRRQQEEHARRKRGLPAIALGDPGSSSSSSASTSQLYNPSSPSTSGAAAAANDSSKNRGGVRGQHGEAAHVSADSGAAPNLPPGLFPSAATMNMDPLVLLHQPVTPAVRSAAATAATAPCAPAPEPFVVDVVEPDMITSDSSLQVPWGSVAAVKRQQMMTLSKTSSRVLVISTT